MMSELRTPIMTENIKLHFTSKTPRITKMEDVEEEIHEEIVSSNPPKKGGPKHYWTLTTEEPLILDDRNIAIQAQHKRQKMATDQTLTHILPSSPTQ